MKKEESKHDHKWTKLLKVGIFSLVMLAPLIAIGVKCAYVTFNKNAKESYYGETINQKQYESITTLKNGNEYNFNTNNTNNFTYIDATKYVIEWKDNITTTYAQAQTLLTALNENDTITIEFNSFNSILQLRFYYGNSTSSSDRFTIVDLSTYSLSFDFYLTSFTSNNYNRFIEKITYNKHSYLDNAFYYAVEQMEQSELFNWTQNTAIYNGVNAVTSGLGIQTQAIPILIVYWFIITLIYIIFDIITETFVWVTHIFSGKIIK